MKPESCKYRTPTGFCMADPDDLDICVATEGSRCIEPMTNFDYIHRMTQEEFAKWLANLDSICECCSYCVDEYCAGEASHCEEGLNEFLNKEYKEDSNV